MNNKNPYIPNGSTPIKNEIIFDIIAKGLLSYSEIRIAMYIIYKSWRYIDQENQRRQDWTNPLSITQIAEDMGVKYPLIHRTLKRMISRKVIFQKDKQYQFNEHYEQYITKSDNQEISLKVIKNITNSYTNITNSYTNITKSDNPQPQTPDEINALSSLNKLSKETSKEKINKRRVKITFNDETFKFQNITEEKIQKWSEAFPGIDIEVELKEMGVWLVANPKNQKENYERFIVNWLSRTKKGGKDGKNKGNNGRYIPITGKRKFTGLDEKAGEW